MFRAFVFWSFDIVSYFDIRILHIIIGHSFLAPFRSLPHALVVADWSMVMHRALYPLWTRKHTSWQIT
jgi:hypothetical protein